MKKNLKHLFKFSLNPILMILLSLSFLNNVNANPKSVQWQSVEFESSLKARVTEIAKQVIDEKTFFVEVDVVAQNPIINIPKFSLLKKKKVKLGSVKNTKNSAEYILFDKVGLNAPSFEGSFDQRQTDLQLQLFQYSKKVEREFLTKTDLFTNLESINIKIGVDKSISKAKIEELKKLLKTLIPKISSVVPTIEILSVDVLSAQLIKNDPLAENLSHIMGPAGIIIAAIIFSISAFLLFSKYRKFKNDIISKEQEAQSVQKELEQDGNIFNGEQKVDPKLRPGSQQLAEAITNTKEGVVRFCLYLEKSPDQAINLIKKWINLNTKMTVESLIVLSEQLSVEELFKIFIKMTSDERMSYQKITGSEELTVGQKFSADKYIGQQVLEDIMSITVIDDKELQQLLVEISPERGAALCLKHKKQGAMLINLVSSEFLGKMFQFVDVESTNLLTEKAMHIKEGDFDQDLSTFKNTIKKFVDNKYKNPFVRRIVELMNDLDFQKSENLIDVLIGSKQFEVLEDVVRNSFPTRLIDKLPVNILKSIFKSMQIDAKVEFLASLEEKRRTRFIRNTTVAGTKGREVLEFELQRVLDNVEAMEYVGENKDKIFSVFVELVRTKIENEESVKNAANNVALKWFKTISEAEDSTIKNAA